MDKDVREVSIPNPAPRPSTAVYLAYNVVNILSPPMDAGRSDKQLQTERSSVSRLVKFPNSSGNCCKLSQEYEISVFSFPSPSTASGKLTNFSHRVKSRCSKSVDWPIDSGSLSTLLQ
ncbi:hypothetical protein M758_UG280800 [Ceratodon purpureus]|nr:hypothetical protein M758_UG280800 [Ceratodon purpureus]